MTAGGTGWWFTQGAGAPTTVPQVRGVPVAEARSRLEQAHLDALVEEAYDETVPAGSVIQAAPEDGTRLHRTDDVTLVVSRGPERYALPQVTGRPVADARQAVTEAHLTVGAVTEDYDETVPAGSVIRSRPAAGGSHKPLTRVDLVVSKGRRPIPVPTVTGRTTQEARAAVEEAGLVWAEAPERVFSSTVPAGSVVRQQPAEGTLVRGDTVTATVSKGPEMVSVPSVTGRRKDDARRALEAAGFTVRVTTPLGEVFGLVSQQRPSGGRAPKGSTVVLVVV